MTNQIPNPNDKLERFPLEKPQETIVSAETKIEVAEANSGMSDITTETQSPSPFFVGYSFQG